MIWRRGAFEIEVEWDHGPDVWIIFYGRRTHIFGISYQAYPVLGGRPALLPWDDPNRNIVADMTDAAKEIASDPNVRPPRWRPSDSDSNWVRDITARIEGHTSYDDEVTDIQPDP